MSSKPVCISARKALILAAEHARMTSQELSNPSVTLDDGFYSVFFCGHGKSYSYIIDAATGKIDRFSFECVSYSV